ncbi:MAG: glucosyl-3-phosphoglycerate synthase [Actinomycetota bacterium]|nr:glucosyl-3-phosphoglycerate synthase [Actinomycetota bacterium]
MTPAVAGGPRRFSHSDFSAGALASAKRSATVSVCLPARDEAATIGRIVGTIREDLVERVHLVDEVLVADDRSTDATAAAAAGAGATVVAVTAAAGSQWGKGAAMATALAASSGDLVVFLDADVEGFSSHFVVGLLGPLLRERDIGFVKATYQRPLAGVRGEGGRVTELTAKPLLALLRPDLAWFTQPLAGEIAARRPVLGGLSLPPDYGVDIALLIDVAGRIGLGAMAEVDLGERRHRNRPLSELAPQARSVAKAILERSGLGTGALGRRVATVHATRFQTTRAG